MTSTPHHRPGHPAGHRPRALGGRHLLVSAVGRADHRPGGDRPGRRAARVGPAAARAAHRVRPPSGGTGPGRATASCAACGCWPTPGWCPRCARRRRRHLDRGRARRTAERGSTGTMAELAETCQTLGRRDRHAAPDQDRRGRASRRSPRVRGCWTPIGCPGRCARHPPAAPARYVLRTLRVDRGLQRTVHRVADRWTADHWMHGDLTADRVRVQRSPTCGCGSSTCAAAGWGSRLGPGGCPRDGGGAHRRPAGAVGAAPVRRASATSCCRAIAGPAGRPRWTRARGRCGSWLAPGTQAALLDARAAHPASMHPAAGRPTEASRLTERLALARELAARSARTGLVAA